MKGQAFVIYNDIDDAIKAQKVMKNRELYGKPMVIQFAKARSDVIVLKDDGIKALEKYQQPRKEAWAKLQKELEEEEKRRAEAKANGTEEDVVINKKKKTLDGKSSITSAGKASSNNNRKTSKEPPAPPNKILFLENLPVGIAQEKLIERFSPYQGFVEVRLFGVRRVGFVEYEVENQAVVVKKELGDEFEIDGVGVKLSYAKK